MNKLELQVEANSPYNDGWTQQFYQDQLNKMTIEGRPDLGPDMTYEQQRKCRLQDSVDEYLQDDEVDVDTFYNDLVDCIQEIADYYRKGLTKAEDALNKVNSLPF